MELTSSALTAALVGVIVVLTKVIEWLIKRVSESGKGKEEKAAKGFNGHGETLMKIETKVDMLADSMQEMRQGRAMVVERLLDLVSGQEHLVERLGDVASSVQHMADNVADLKAKHR